MSYIPAQQPTVDPAGVADLFSEYLINPYGRWYAVEPSFQHLALDGINKLVRNFSLHVYRGDEGWQKGQPLGTDAIYFSFDSPVNMTYMEKVSLLFHMYDRFYGNETWTEPILTGDLIISLTDINQLAIYSPFYQKNTNLQPWNDTLPYDRTPVETAKSQFTGTALPQFDWTKVVAITIYVGTNAIPWYDPLPIAGYDLWIDGGPFILFSANASFLQINCQTADGTPITLGKHMELTDNINPSVTTPYPIPASYGVTGSSYTVKITDPDFLHWSDGTTAPKVVSVGAGTTTLTAIFGGGGGDFTIPLVVSAIAIGGIALYYLRGRK